MKKKNIRRLAISLALLNSLTLSGCKSNNNINENNNEFLLYSNFYDEEGNYHVFVEVEPVIVLKMEQNSAQKSVNGKTEDTIAYHLVKEYFAPDGAVAVETENGMKCYKEVIYYNHDNNRELVLK